MDPQDLVEESILELPDGWRSRELFDQLFEEHRLQRQVRLEVDDWFGVLSMVQRGMGISYGPPECIDDDIFSGVAVATPAKAPLWELGITSRDEVLRGAAGRAFLAAYLRQCANAPNRWPWDLFAAAPRNHRRRSQDPHGDGPTAGGDMSERVIWGRCPSCGDLAALGWTGNTLAEVDCRQGCVLTEEQIDEPEVAAAHDSCRLPVPHHGRPTVDTPGCGSHEKW